MIKKAIISPASLVVGDNKAKYSAFLEYDGALREIWFSFPEAYAKEVPDSLESFLLVALFWSMEHVDELHVQGALPEGLLANLEEYMQIWHCWRPERYSPVRISCDRICETRNESERHSAVLSFSGGLDACFTLHRHAQKLVGNRSWNIRAAVMVHGFDLPLTMDDAFERARLSAEKIVSGYGIAFVSMRTNARDFQTNWEDCFLAMVAAALGCFSKNMGVGLAAGGDDYRVIRFPWGSSPVSDHLLGSDQFRIWVDGTESNRVEKGRLVSSSPLVCEYLRVCWQLTANGDNCCVCEKCVRTILGFKAAGLSVPKAFPHEITPEQVLNIRLSNQVQRDAMSWVLAEAEANGLENEEWCRALKSVLGAHELTPMQRLRKDFRQAASSLKRVLKGV